MDDRKMLEAYMLTGDNNVQKIIGRMLNGYPMKNKKDKR